MRVFLFLFALLFVYSCNRDNPISGVFKSADNKILAVITDSTLWMISGSDTSLFALSYNLHVRETIHYKEDVVRIYSVVYGTSLSDNGHGNFLSPIVFKNDSLYGGTLIATFINSNFSIGGYSFVRENDKKEAKRIFDIWLGLMTNNLDYKLLKLQE